MSRIRTLALAAVASLAVLSGSGSVQAQQTPDDIGRAITELARILNGVQQGLTNDNQACNLALVRIDQNLTAAEGAWSRDTLIKREAAAQNWIAVYGQYNCNPGPLLRLLEVHEGK
ncbi:MAG: hypothetical protein GC134_05975 [Proteobacteria bacterium]|nr:hypothetical protein [Pseudomonadota bacterium]